MTVVSLIKWIAIHAIGYQTPLRIISWFHNIPSAWIFILKFFLLYVMFIYTHQRDKFDPRALKCVFVGYYNSQKGYKCFHPTSKYYVYMDV